jgi:arylformamidase
MKVYKQYDQDQLNAQYNNRAMVPDFAEYVQQWQQQSEALRQDADVVKDLRYGEHERECLDIFPARQPDAPVQVFFHGGYWQAMQKDVFHFLAKSFLQDGVTMVFVNYPLAPQATMDDIVSACRRAIVWLHRHIQHYHGNPGQLHVSGHSAGGHIVAMLLATEWPTLDRNIPGDVIKGGCAISGLFTLIPIQRCYLNAALGMDEAVARRNSPQYLSPTCSAPLIVSVGELESDEYHAQSSDFAANWTQHGTPITELTIPAANHFSILDHVYQPEASLYHTIITQMKA